MKVGKTHWASSKLSERYMVELVLEADNEAYRELIDESGAHLGRYFGAGKGAAKYDASASFESEDGKPRRMNGVGGAIGTDDHTWVRGNTKNAAQNNIAMKALAIRRMSV